MKRRCYGDIHRWIGDVHRASANNPLIFGNSSAIVLGLPPSIGNHRRTFNLWKNRILPNVSVTFTNALPNYRCTPPIIHLGTFMCDCKPTSCQYREQSRQIATFFHRETSLTLMWVGHNHRNGQKMTKTNRNGVIYYQNRGNFYQNGLNLRRNGAVAYLNTDKTSRIKYIKLSLPKQIHNYEMKARKTKVKLAETGTASLLATQYLHVYF